MLRVMVSERAKRILEGKSEQEVLSGAGVEHQKIIANVLIGLILKVNDAAFGDNFVAVPETRIKHNTDNSHEYIEPDVCILDGDNKVYFWFEIQYSADKQYPESRYKDILLRSHIIAEGHNNNILIMYRKANNGYEYYKPHLSVLKCYDKEEDLRHINYEIADKKRKKILKFSAADLLSAESMLHSRRILSETHKRIDSLENKVDSLENKVDQVLKILTESQTYTKKNTKTKDDILGGFDEDSIYDNFK